MSPPDEFVWHKTKKLSFQNSQQLFCLKKKIQKEIKHGQCCSPLTPALTMYVISLSVAREGRAFTDLTKVVQVTTVCSIQPHLTSGTVVVVNDRVPVEHV